MKKLTKIGIILIGSGLLLAIITINVFQVDFNRLVNFGNRSPFININNHANDQKISNSYETLKSIDINVDLGKVIIENSETISLEIEYCQQCHDVFEVNENEGNLVIKGSRNQNRIFFFGINANNTVPVIRLKVPTDLLIDQLILDSSLGETNIKGINVKQAEINAQLGSITVRDSFFDQLDVVANMGDVDLKGNINQLSSDVDLGKMTFEGSVQKVDVDNSMGDTNLKLQGSIDDYQIEVSSSMGSINIDGISKDGIDNQFEYNLNKGLQQYLDISNSMGSVTVTFVE